ncbi:hypothetical protein MFIFM68171_08421 [Madurella fahalii]|uniref:F-box domain-containing protein n=1 Tax=Madurella fahalii TaxID=1157608 RepID=A0ABQ0GKD0_9PEZI
MELPPELVSHILGFLGPDFFRRDISRLTVSKRWYALAWPIFVSHLELTTTSLKTLMRDDGTLLKRGLPHITAVGLSFRGFVPETDGPDSHGAESELSATAAANIWTIRLNCDLVNLAASLQECPRLRCLKLRAEPQGSEGNSLRPGYLAATPLADLLSLRHLTSLEIDIFGAHPRPRNPTVHLCDSINSLLPSLRRLRCRMGHLCERLLELPASATPFSLEEVIIGLCRTDGLPPVSRYQYADPCKGSKHSESVLEFYFGIEDQARTLSSRLRNPRMVRVIWEDVPNRGISALDAVAWKWIRLPPGAQWDAQEMDESALKVLGLGTGATS